MKLTPVLFLYMRNVEGFKRRSRKDPTDDEKRELYLESMAEYEHATVHDKIVIDRQVEMLNDINYANEERRKKIVKPKSKRKN